MGAKHALYIHIVIIPFTDFKVFDFNYKLRKTAKRSCWSLWCVRKFVWPWCEYAPKYVEYKLTSHTSKYNNENYGAVMRMCEAHTHRSTWIVLVFCVPEISMTIHSAFWEYILENLMWHFTSDSFKYISKWWIPVRNSWRKVYQTVRISFIKSSTRKKNISMEKTVNLHTVPIETQDENPFDDFEQKRK